VELKRKGTSSVSRLVQSMSQEQSASVQELSDEVRTWRVQRIALLD
jgi:hypothetical protein